MWAVLYTGWGVYLRWPAEAPEERACRRRIPRWARAAPLARHRRAFMSGAGPSSSGGHSSTSHVDGESLALMRRLQEEDDAAQEPGLQPHALGLQPRTRPAVRRTHPATLHSWRLKGVRTWLGLEPRRGALTLTLTLTFALTRCAHSRRCRAGSTAGGSGPPVGGGLEQPPAAQWTAPDCEDGELDTRCAGAQARGAPRSQRNMANVPPSRATVSLLPGLLHVLRRRASTTQAPVSAHGVAVKRAPKSPMSSPRLTI